MGYAKTDNIQPQNKKIYVWIKKPLLSLTKVDVCWIGIELLSCKQYIVYKHNPSFKTTTSLTIISLHYDIMILCYTII